MHLSKAQFALYGLSAVLINSLRRIGRPRPARKPQDAQRKHECEYAWPSPTAQDTAAQRASGSSFYTAMRILPRAQREAMFEIYSFCRKVDDIADDGGPRDERLDQLQLWRSDIDALYTGSAVSRATSLAAPVKTFGLQREDFLAVIDGMEMDVVADIRAPDWAKLDPYCDRVASAVGRLSVRVFGMEEKAGIALAHHLGRALQLTNILRDIDEDAAIGRLYLPREALQAAGITSTDPAAVAGASAPRRGLRAGGRARARAFRRSRPHHGRAPAPHACARRASWARLSRDPAKRWSSAAGRRRARR